MARRLALVALVTLALSVLNAAPAAAAELKVAGSQLLNGQSWLNGFPTSIHDYHWSTARGGRWVDDRCGTRRQRFMIVLYQHKDFGGNSVVVCHSYTHSNDQGKAGASLCEVPLGTGADVFDAAACNLSALFTSGVANDKISSIDVVSLRSDQCLRLFEHGDHKGRYLKIDGDIRNLHRYRVGGSSMGDRISSIKLSPTRTCAGAVG